MNKVYINFASSVATGLTFCSVPVKTVLLKDIISFILNTLSVSDKEISVLICDNEFIQGLNRDFRNKDMPTDVLSFCNADSEGDFDDDKFLGDMAVSIEKAFLQSKEHGRSFEMELCHLMVHGVLHLLGYDHERSDKDKEIMERLEEKVLMEVSKTFIC